MNRTDLRQQAETKLSQKKYAAIPAKETDTLRLLHELHVHQIELDMQNEELVQARAEMETVLREYADLYDFAPVGYFTLARDGAISKVNLAGANLLDAGAERGKLIQRRLGLFVSVEFRPQFSAFLDRVFISGRNETCEIELLKDGSTPLWVHLEAVIDSDQRETCRLVAVDISERKQAEKALRVSQEQFRIAQDMSPDGFTILRPIRDSQERVIDFTWIYENAAVAQLNGTDPEAVVGQRLLDLFPGHRGTPFLKAYQQVAESGESFIFESDYHGESITKPTSFRIVVVPMAGDIAILAQDITERKQAEELIRQYAGELEKRVQERTAELIHANQAKDEFLASMSHELRTPLNGILGFSESLLEGVYGSVSEKQNRTIEAIHFSGQHLLELINDILDVSKIAAGKLELHPESVSVDFICESSLVFIKQLAFKKSITVEYESSAPAPIIFADPMRLKQILVNLLNNAVKFTPKNGSIKFEVQEDTLAGQIHFSITDNGIGISPEDQQKLFKPFVQLDSSLSRQHEGSGLGLMLVKQLVEMHGGNVTVESEAGKGSCFHFVIPTRRP